MALGEGGAYHAGMLPETRATSYAHDASLGTVVLYTVGGEPTALHGDQPARLLLDAAGHLVGVDVAPDRPERRVVMLGPHESVATTKDARVHVDGQKVMLQGSFAKLVTPGASPYVF